MFRRNRQRSSTGSKSEDASSAPAILSRIEVSLAEARSERSFPSINEGRRLMNELESLVQKMKTEDRGLWESQLQVVKEELDSVMNMLIEPAPSTEAMEPAPTGGLFDGLDFKSDAKTKTEDNNEDDGEYEDDDDEDERAH